MSQYHQDTQFPQVTTELLRNLSFVLKVKGSNEVVSHWIPVRDQRGLHSEHKIEGLRRFSEVAKLAKRSPKKAEEAIRLAVTSRDWDGRWGCEDGFIGEVARAAVRGVIAGEV